MKGDCAFGKNLKPANITPAQQRRVTKYNSDIADRARKKIRIAATMERIEVDLGLIFDEEFMYAEDGRRVEFIESLSDVIYPQSYFLFVTSRGVTMGRSNEFGVVRTKFSSVCDEDLYLRWSQVLKPKWRRSKKRKEIPAGNVCPGCNEVKENFVRTRDKVMCLSCNMRIYHARKRYHKRTEG